MLTRQSCGGDTCSPEPPIRDFPGPIRLALSRAAACDGAGLQQLDAGERALLVRLVRNVSVVTPEESVRIANPTLAAGLHVSERTIHRMKAGLEAKGWITRHQVQSRRRGMQISDVRLTRHALETLGLAGAAAPAPLRACTAVPASAKSGGRLTDSAICFTETTLRGLGISRDRNRTVVAYRTAPEARTCRQRRTHLATRAQACVHEE